MGGGFGFRPTFKERRMVFDKTATVKEMKKYALEELGVDIAENITGRDIVISKIQEVIDFREAEYKKEAKSVKSQKPFADEDKMKIKFTFPESPGCALTFDYEGFDAKLIDGREYELPMSIIKHLNACTQPVYEPVKEEGQVCKKVGDKNRFALIPV
jgi:hypothetical protein